MQIREIPPIALHNKGNCRMKITRTQMIKEGKEGDSTSDQIMNSKERDSN